MRAKNYRDFIREGASDFSKLKILTAGLLVVSIFMGLQNVRAGGSEFSSNPKDRQSYWRKSLPEDYVSRRTPNPLTGAALTPSVYLCDVVVSNTDASLKTSDTFGDEEPSIAINPFNTNEIIILSFAESWGSASPWWHTTDGGLTWTKRFGIPAPDSSLFGPADQCPDWGRNNQLAGVFLTFDPLFGDTDAYAGVTTDPKNPASFIYPLSGGSALPADWQFPFYADQPQLLVNADPGNPNRDNIYVAYDDFFGAPDMRVAVSFGMNPASFNTDQLVGYSTGGVNPGLRMAKDPRKGYMYAMWQRNIATGQGGSKNINFMLNRSTDGGLSWRLNGSTTGIIVANADSSQPTPKFGGVNALLGGVDHPAVDPNNGNVYCVYGSRDANSGINRLAVRCLRDDGAGGLSIGPEFIISSQADSALPCVAVNSKGVVGVLFDTYDGPAPSGYPMFSAHLAVSIDSGTNWTDTILFSFVSSAQNNSSDSRQRVLGDYQQLKTAGDTFYGVFTGNGVQLGRPIANHDPIFFKANVPLTPSIDTQPLSQAVFQGDNATLTVAASGLQPISYQWRFNATNLAGATDTTLVFTNVALTQAGTYSVVASNSAGITISSNALLTVIPTVPLPLALNATNLLWLTGGDANWHGLTNISHDGFAAGRSGPVANSQATMMTTTINGPGTLTFWWKVSSQTNKDILSFTSYDSSLTNTVQISGEVDWQKQTIFLPAGSENLQWLYAKDGSLSVGQDAGWVDQVSFVPGATLPTITQQPVGANVFAATPTTFKSQAIGTPVLSYQWLFNGSPIPGATSTSYKVSNPGIRDGGYYALQAVNPFGTTVSEGAFLSVVALVLRGDNSLSQVDASLLATNAIQVSAGAFHNLLLRGDGSMLTWGENFDGQCDIPAGVSNVLALAAGGYHSLALRNNGTVVGWGANYNGESTPPSGLSNVVAIAAGTSHSLALKFDGTVVAWGDNSFGQTSVPAGLSNVMAIAAGGNHNLALKFDGTVVAWGENQDAQGSFVGQSTVPFGLSNVKAIAAGDYHSIAVKADGTVVAWGDDSEGQTDVPAGLNTAVYAVGGGSHTVVLNANSTVVGFGNNFNGQIDFPAGLSNVVAMTAGNAHTLLIEGNTDLSPHLLKPARKNGRFGVLLQTFGGKNYILEYKTSLGALTWTTANTLLGSGGYQYLIDPAATAPQRYYRVRQQ